MHKQHPQTAYRKDAVLIGTIFEDCDNATETSLNCISQILHIANMLFKCCANFLTCDSHLYRISQRITPQGAVASCFAAVPYYVIADRSSVNVFRISST